MIINIIKLANVLALSTFVLACAPVANQLDQTESQPKESTIDKSKLDLLTDYDREIWAGPDGWSASQWQWKQTLKWDRHCDYVAEVEVVDISKTLQIITVQCIPGAYQPMHYVYLLDKSSNNHWQLEIPSEESPQEIWGHIEINAAQAEISVLSLSRGLGDCGTFNRFKVDIDAPSAFELIERRQQSCRELPNMPIEDLPKDWLDPKQWPATPL